MKRFGFDRMYTFVYHKDMKKVDWFYGSLLGLEMEPESDWVNLYKVSEGMTIGVVQDGRGYLRVTDDKPVIICLGVPDDGDIWEVYNRLKVNGVKMHTDEVARARELDRVLPVFLALPVVLYRPSVPCLQYPPLGPEVLELLGVPALHEGHVRYLVPEAQSLLWR
jgi:hypothetical protein